MRFTNNSAGDLSKLELVFAGIVIAGIFVYSAGFGMKTGLGNDDVMNLTYSWTPSLRELAVALLVPFTHFYRPTGAALYVAVFDLAGLNPVPFRAVVYILLSLNLWLTYKLAQTLTKSREVGVLSALLYAFHGRLSDIYLNNGTIYDVLCATFSLSAILFYVGARDAGHTIAGWRAVGVILIFIFAINAKEMAAAIPALFLLYELIYHPPRSLYPATVLRWIGRNCLPAIACAVLALLAAKSKMGAGSLMHDHPAYAMTFTTDQFFEHWRRLMSHLIYAPGEYSRGEGLTVQQTLAIWFVLVLIAAIIRQKSLWFFVGFALLAPLPVIFIPFRGFFVMYFPLAGWAMTAATLIVATRKWLFRTPVLVPASRIFVFAATAAFVLWMPKHDPNPELVERDPAQRVIQLMRRDIIALNEPLPKAASVLFRHDRFPPDAWGTLMMCRLLYRDPDLSVDRPTMMKTVPDEAGYDRVLDYVDGKLTVVRSRPPRPEQIGTTHYPR